MQDPPTNVRFRILVLLMATAVLVHFNRISISVAGTEHFIKKGLIGETQMGFVYSAYLFVYTLCMLPGGWLIDRWGPKKALLLLGYQSAILVPLTGLAGSASAANLLVMLLVIRALLGVVSAPMHPGAARAISFWMPYQARGVANGLVTGAAVTGVASTYFVFGYLMDHVGLPAAFLLAGIVTLLVSITWWICATDRPREHRSVNAAERQLIEQGDAGQPNQREIAVEPLVGLPGFEPITVPGPIETQGGLLSMFQNRSLVLLTISYATLSYFQYLFFYWMQYYFDHVLNLGKDDGRLYATITNVAMVVGMISGGWLADRLQLRFGGWLGRALAPASGMIASAVLLVMGIVWSEPAWVVTCFALAMAALGSSEASFWVTGIELGRHRGGLSAAFLNTGGNAGGILAPVITPLFSKYFGWQAGLGLASVLCIIGAALWWWINPYEGQET